MADDLVSKADIDEAMTLLKGVSLIAYEPGGRQLLQTESGEYVATDTAAWIKLSAAFRTSMLAKLPGAMLPVFLCICLHIDESGKSYPGVILIAKETGLDRKTVMLAIGKLEGIPGLLTVIRRAGRVNVYRPAFAAYGKTSPKNATGTSLIRQPVPVSPPDQSLPVGLEVEPSISRTKEVEKDSGAGAPPSENGQRHPAKVEDPATPPGATKAIQAQYEALLGYKLGKDWVKGESTAAKAIAARWNTAQLSAAYMHYKADPFWSDKRLSLAYLLKQMPEYFRNGATHNGASKQADKRDGSGSPAGEGGGDNGIKSPARIIAERLSRGESVG